MPRQSQKKIALSPSRDVPFNKLVLSQANVRKVKVSVSIEQLAESIARRTLLQSLSVRAVTDARGKETGMFEVPAGGRRYRALELLVKQKRLARNAPVPCVVRENGCAEEDSLAENIERAPLHPLDQFRAFVALREQGQSEEEIAAAFFVTSAVVKQRLRLASVSDKLLDIYAEDGITLDQLMAFTVSTDHERQEQVYEMVKESYNREPYTIRRMLTEGAVPASDKRVQYIGVEAYVEAGGAIMRDLFAQGEDGEWLQDASLLDMLVSEKLKEDAEPISEEGWHWIEVAPDFAYGHTYGLRQIRGVQEPLTDEEQEIRQALVDEADTLLNDCPDGEDLSEDADARLAEIEASIDAIDDRPRLFEDDEKTIAGAFVTIDSSGNLRVERGFVRSEDEPTVESEAMDEEAKASCDALAAANDDGEDADQNEPELDEGLKPISDRLMTELTAHRTLALRHALGGNPHIAFIAALHALTLKVFYRYGTESCIEIDLKSVGFGAQAPGIGDTKLAEAFDKRHRDWIEALPKEPEDLWDALVAFDKDRQASLFAHCISLSVNAMHEAYNRRPRALAHADRLATELSLDMIEAGWTPTAESYFGKVTKARILDAVTQARGDEAAQNIASLKKDAMATRAESLIGGTDWLPEPLRTPVSANEAEKPAGEEADQAETADNSETDPGEESASDAAETVEQPGEEEFAEEVHAVAAE